MLGERWGALGESEKLSYQVRADAQKAKYTIDFAAYIVANPDSIAAQPKVKAGVKGGKKKATLKKSKKSESEDEASDANDSE